MRAFVTGISGFVGSHLAEHLLAVGDEVLGSARQGDQLRNVPQGVQVATWDLANQSPHGEVLEAAEHFAPDVIYHLAAVSIPADCGTSEPTAAAWALNVDGVRRVLELAACLARRPRVVFASSSRVYAPVEPARPVVDEQSPCDPRGAYGKTKLAAEELCREAARCGAADVVIVRSFAQAGPRQDPRLMLAEWARQLAGSAPTIEVGNLHVTVDLLDVRDSVRALRSLALHGVSGEVYNVGSGTPRTTGELFDLLRQAAGDRRPVRERESAVRSDPIADIGKLQAAAAWRPERTAAEMVAGVWEYWRDQVVQSGADRT